MVKLHRISLIESYIIESRDLTLEAKKDLDDLKDYLGGDLFDSYMKIRDRIPKDKNDFKDFSKLKKMDKKDIQDFVSSFQSKSDKKKKDKQEGAEKLYEDSDWTVYKITSYPAAQLYGKGTKWCITGRYPGHEDRGEGYFNSYIRDNNLDGGYYFYLNKKDPSEKYCVLQTKDKEIHSIWDAEDFNKGSSILDLDVSLPEIKEVNLHIPTNDDLLLHFSKMGNVEKIRELLDKGADINVRGDYYGQTPLICCLFNARAETPAVYLLLKAGADVNDYKALYKVLNSSKDHRIGKDILALLLDAGADPNIKDPYNRKEPLIAEALNIENNDAIYLLVKAGADVNTKNKYGIYPLIYACKEDDVDLVKLLLDSGANPNIKDRSGNTPISLAKEQGNKNVIELLKEYGAKE